MNDIGHRVVCQSRFVTRLGPGRGLSILLLLLVSLTPLSLQSQSNAPVEIDTQALGDLSLADLMQVEVATVFGASKFEQSVTEAPSSITVIPREEIKRYGYRTLSEALQSAQGFHVSNDRNYDFLGTRGINLGDFNSRILLLVNGHRLNNNLTDGAYLGTASFLDVDLIERIEIIRGPGSVLYGNNAFFGVINIITRDAAKLDGLEVSGEAGAPETFKARATYGKEFANGLKLLMSGSIFDSEGDDSLFYPEFNTPGQNNGIARHADGDTYGSFFTSLAYQDWTLEGGYLRREKHNPTAQYFTTFNDSRLATTDERSYANLQFRHSFPEVVDVTAKLSYDRNDFRVGYPLVLAVGTNLMDFSSVERDSGEWWGAELQFDKQLFDRHIISLGFEYRDDFKQERQVSGQIPVAADRQSHGIFLQGDFAILTNLHCNTGVRYDQYGDFDSAYNPRLGLIYHPVSDATIKALYGSAFRVPNFLELSSPQFLNIEPEEITSYELVYEQNLTSQLRSSVSTYYNEMDDLIVFSSGNFRNFDANARGAELALAGNWTNGVSARLSYSLQKAESQSVGWELPDSPEHLVKLNLSAPIYRDKLFAGLEFQFTSSRRSLHNTTDSFGQPLTVQGSNVGSYGIVNFTLFAHDLIENLDFSASVYNLLDERYSDPATRFHTQDTLERPGRTFRIKLTYRF